MDRRETISVDIDDIIECIKKKIYLEYPYLNDKDIVSLNLKSNIKFILFDVVRRCDE